MIGALIKSKDITKNLNTPINYMHILVLDHICSLRFISFNYVHMLVPRLKIEFKKVLRLTQLVEQICDEQNEILILHCNFI